jgi:hypothetical protein
MLNIQPLDNIPVWLLFIIETVVFFIAAEIGLKLRLVRLFDQCLKVWCSHQTQMKLSPTYLY